MKEAFVTGDGERLRFPGDSSLGASAGNTASCRCVVNLVFDEDQDETASPGVPEETPEQKTARLRAEAAGVRGRLAGFEGRMARADDLVGVADSEFQLVAAERSRYLDATGTSAFDLVDRNPELGARWLRANRGLAEASNAQSRIGADLAVEARQLVSVTDPSKVAYSPTATWKGRVLAKLNEGVEHFQDLVSAEVLKGRPSVRVAKGRGWRSYHSGFDPKRPDGINIGKGINYDGPRGRRSIVHELGHHLESQPEILAKSLAYRETRITSRVSERLRDLTGTKGYGRNEGAFPSTFKDAYTAKVYPNDVATEVVSMGLEAMTDPVKFATEDPDFFDFIYALGRGG